jgi:predicted ArsR family transcriptional regulator
MSTEKNGEELANQLYVIMQPTRLKIVKLLRESKPLYIEQIAEKISEDRRSVSFHLATLAESGFVEGDYEIIQDAKKNPGVGRAAKFYRLTIKIDDVLKRLDRVLG